MKFILKQLTSRPEELPISQTGCRLTIFRDEILYFKIVLSRIGYLSYFEISLEIGCAMNSLDIRR